MDMTWVTDRIALGGGIWNAKNMAEVANSGITHVIDMQIEFDDTPLGAPAGVRVLWNPTDDDFLPKPSELLERGVEFALEAAMIMIETRRPEVDFADVYVESVRRYLGLQKAEVRSQR